MNTFTLKMIALILMVIDHIGLYFEGAPLWFRCLGRVSFPLFLFCMVWGYHYTKNRKKYLLRLYGMSLFMTAFCYIMGIYFQTEDGFGYGYHNIFLSMFLVGILISTIELFIKDQRKGGIALGAIFLVQVLYYVLPQGIPFLRYISGDVLTGLIPNLVHNEYGSDFIILGILMYFLKEKKEAFCAMYILFCIIQFSMEMREGMGIAVQWLMILALPLMMRYNKEKGPGMKYLFYIFYPAHTFLLFYLANYVL